MNPERGRKLGRLYGLSCRLHLKEFQNMNPERGRKLSKRRCCKNLDSPFQNMNPERGRKLILPPCLTSGYTTYFRT